MLDLFRSVCQQLRKHYKTCKRVDELPKKSEIAKQCLHLLFMLHMWKFYILQHDAVLYHTSM